jgi:hypothetical protein
MPTKLVMLTVIALVPVEHDLVRSEPGDEFELTEAQAAPLLAVNAVKLKEEAAAADAPAVPATPAAKPKK